MDAEPLTYAGLPTRIVVPAQSRFLQMVRFTVRTVFEEAGCDEETVRDLVLATDEIASVVLLGSTTDAELEVELDADALDLYVRVCAPLADGDFTPKTPELTLLLLSAVTDSFDLRIHDRLLVGVIQRGFS